VVVQGRTSGHAVDFQVRVLATDALTPGAEAAESSATPEGQQAVITPALLEVGGLGAVRAEGFAPGERTG
jgi:hypothetical protein